MRQIETVMSPALLSRTLVTFFLAFSATIADLLVASSSFPVDATHVPTFYVPQHEGPSYINVIPLFHVAHVAAFLVAFIVQDGTFTPPLMHFGVSLR